MNMFYRFASEKFEEKRIGQIKKGLQEYGKTYDPLQFTPEEQLDHFMSELPDVLHYGAGMYITIKQLQEDLEGCYEHIEELKAKIQHLQEQTKETR